MPTDLTACRCEECSADSLPTYTSQYRLECEARHVANIKGAEPEIRNERRSAYLAEVFVRRGAVAYARLRKEVWTQMNKLGITP